MKKELLKTVPYDNRSVYDQHLSISDNELRNTAQSIIKSKHTNFDESFTPYDIYGDDYNFCDKRDEFKEWENKIKINHSTSI